MAAWELRVHGLGHTDRIDRATLKALNAEVSVILAAGDGKVNATDVLHQVISEHRMEQVDTTNPRDTDSGYVELWKLPDGKHTTVWFVSRSAPLTMPPPRRSTMRRRWASTIRI
jgi:uncharacterized iron-regulated membrane protein